jgi:rhamnosyltransferase
MHSVAILLAAYNGERYLREQITSILEQEDVNVTVFVFDDCSKDGSWELVQKMARESDRIVASRNPAPSGSAFANFYLAISGFDSGRFDYVGFSDQDDIWLPRKLRTQITTMHATGSEGCSTSVTAFYANGDKRFIDNSGMQTPIDFLFTGGGQGCTYLLTRSLFNNLQSQIRVLQPVGVPHDWLVYALSRHQGFKWSILRESLIEYRQHENVFGARNSFKGVMFRLRMLGSKRFLCDRLALLAYILRAPGAKPQNETERLRHAQASFFSRLRLAVVFAYQFRRTKKQSIAMAGLYALGLA